MKKKVFILLLLFMLPFLLTGCGNAEKDMIGRVYISNNQDETWTFYEANVLVKTTKNGKNFFEYKIENGNIIGVSYNGTSFLKYKLSNDKKSITMIGDSKEHYTFVE